MIRLFAAMEIPGDIQSKISELKDVVIGGSSDLKWEKREKIHLTLKFIGEVENELVAQVINSLDFLEQCNKISCRLTKFGFFFRQGIPQILWIGLSVDEILFDIVGQLNSKLTKFGIPVEEKNSNLILHCSGLKGNFRKTG